MYKKLGFVGLLVALVFTNDVSFGQNYYYSSEQQIPLNIDNSKFVLKFNDVFGSFGPLELSTLERVEAMNYALEGTSLL